MQTVKLHGVLFISPVLSSSCKKLLVCVFLLLDLPVTALLSSYLSSKYHFIRALTILFTLFKLD